MKSIRIVSVFTCLLFPALGIMAADVDGSKPKPVKETVELVPLSPAPNFSSKIEFCGKSIDLSRYDMYERFDRELTTMTYAQSSTLRIIKLANRYFPVIEPILEEMGVPNDMKYLAVIESSLNVRAISPAKAAGLWQFMPATGRQYGLEVNDTIDERMHVELSTIAACKYLKDMYAKFQDWPTVAASYNIGAGRITTELANQKAQTSLDLWLVEETSRYVFRILAAKELMSHPSRYGYHLKVNQLYKPIRCNDVVVNAPVDDLYKFATDNNTTYYLIKDFNPWLRNKSISNVSGKLYKVKIPVSEDLNYTSESKAPYDKNWVTE
jgi:Predicted soluble lytic transglycosylase fused to an ABC-type amino acid-binding protein